MKLVFFIFGSFFFAFSAYTQDEGENNNRINLSVDLFSNFVWRGMSLNTSPVIQPEVSISLGNFSFGAWASTPFTPGEYNELDLFVNYQLTSSMSVSIMDYFDYGSWWSSPSFFEYTKDLTNHTIDILLAYDGSGIFPVRTMLSTVIGGNDLNDKGKRNYSTYLEVGYENTARNGIEWEVFLGFVPMKSDFYEVAGAWVTNIGFGVGKNFEITPTYTLPLAFKISLNPAHEYVFFTAAVALF